jgi:hypothetical protein
MNFEVLDAKAEMQLLDIEEKNKAICLPRSRRRTSFGRYLDMPRKQLGQSE